MLTNVVNYWQSELKRTFDAGGVTEQFEHSLYAEFQRLRMPQDVAAPFIRHLHYIRNLSEIQWGNIPTVQVSIHLDSDETAHFSLPTIYYKQNKQVRLIPGRLIGTNKNMYFVSDTGRDNAKLDWNNVLEVSIHSSVPPNTPDRIHVRVARGTGGGTYSFRALSDALYAKTIIDTLVKLWKRQLVLYKEQSAQGAIPEHVRNTVFHRDGGRCAQCGSSDYPEFDHRIPRSKGGQNTVENIQILCRRCNLKKGNRL